MSTGAGADFPRRPPSGIEVLVVGAGFAGLAAAIECDRKGHSVTLLEKADDVDEITRLGDIISFDPNGSRAFERWPGVIEAMEKVVRQTTWLDMYNHEGKFVTRQSFAGERKWGRRINGHRGELHGIIYRHALARGIDVRLGHKVTDYFEDGRRADIHHPEHMSRVMARYRHSIETGEHFDNRAAVFGYVVMRVPMVSQWLRAAHQDPLHRRTCQTYATTITISQIGWVRA